MQFTTDSIRNQHHQQRKASQTKIPQKNSECQIITRISFEELIYFFRQASCCASEPLHGKELVFFYINLQKLFLYSEKIVYVLYSHGV